MLRVLHLLPHRGGGAETYIDVLEELDDVEHDRRALSASRTLRGLLTTLPGGWGELRRACSRADVVHVHGDAASIVGLPLLRGPAVMTTHGLHLLRRTHGPARLAVRRALIGAVRAAAVTLCCSNDERAALRAELPASLHGRLEVVRNGITLPRVDLDVRRNARAELGLTDGDVVGLFLGELEERKDPLTAVRAANRAADDVPFVLLVAGVGPQEAAVRAAANGAVRMLGFRSDPGPLLAAADVSVMPSRREGLSFAVLEAMGHGLAMVVSDGAGNPEAVGDTGVIVPTGDVEGFARAFADLARDRDRREQLGRRARERVAEEFTADVLRAGVRAAYARAVGQGA